MKKINYVYIDLQNLHMGLLSNNVTIDYISLFDYLKGRYKTVNIYAYLRRDITMQKFYEELSNIGYKLSFCLIHNRVNGKNKANIDTLLAVEALKNYYEVEERNLILISGDGDFLPLINFYENKNKFVAIISVSKSTTSKFLERKSKKHFFKPRNITYILEHLSFMTKKVPPFGGEGT